MAQESTFQLGLEGVGISVEGIVEVAPGLLFVIHTKCLLDIAAMDLDDPPALLGKGDLFGIGPIDPSQKGCLLTDQGFKAGDQISCERWLTTPHEEVLTRAG